MIEMVISNKSRRIISTNLLLSDTAVRFVVLVLTTFAAASTMLFHVGAVVGKAVTFGCASEAGIIGLDRTAVTSRSSIVSYETVALVRCMRASLLTSLEWSIGGLLAVTLLTAVVFWCYPLAYIRCRGLTRIDPEREPEFTKHCAVLVDRMGLTVEPLWYEEPIYLNIGGRTFGSTRRPRIAVTTDLIQSFRSPNPKPQVDATLLHELAHIANRDITRTYLCVASWYALVVVAIVPYIVAVLTTWTVAGLETSTRLLVSATLLVASVYLNRVSVLRSREFHADVQAARIDSGVIVCALNSPSRKRLAGWIRWHPSRAARQRMVAQPAGLLGIGVLPLLSTGVALMAVGGDVTLLQGSAIGIAIAAGLNGTVIFTIVPLAGSLFVPSMLAWLAAVTLWQARLRRELDGTPLPVLKGPLLLAAGMVIGEPLSLAWAAAGSWGAFDLRDTTRSVLAVGVLLGLLVALFGIAADLADVWFPVIRKSPRQLCAATAVVCTLWACMPLNEWTAFHGSPIVHGGLQLYPGAGLFLFRPDRAFIAPFTSWVAGGYLPLEVLASLPGVSLLLAAPLAMFGLALTRDPALIQPWLREMTEQSRRVRPQIKRAFVAGAAASAGFVLSGVVAAVVLRWWLRPAYITNHLGSTNGYMLHLMLLLTIIWAVVAATVTAARSAQGGVVLGITAAFVCTVFTTVAVPFVTALALAGPRRAFTVAIHHGQFAPVYGLFGMFGTTEAVTLAGVSAAIVNALCRSLRKHRGHTRIGTPYQQVRNRRNATIVSPMRSRVPVVLGVSLIYLAVTVNVVFGIIVGYI